MTALDASTFGSWNDSWNGSWIREWGCDLRGGRKTWVDPDDSAWAFAGAVVHGDATFAIPEPVGQMLFTDVAGDSSHRRRGLPSDGDTWTVDQEIDDSRRAGRTTG